MRNLRLISSALIVLAFFLLASQQGYSQRYINHTDVPKFYDVGMEQLSTGDFIRWGKTSYGFTFNGNPIPSSTASILVYDVNGNEVWGEFFTLSSSGTSDNIYVNCVSVAPNGDILALLALSGTIDIEGVSYTGASDVLFVRYSSTGAHLSTDFLSASVAVYGSDVMQKTNGDFVIAGNAYGSVKLNGIQIIPNSTAIYQSVLLTLAPNRTYKWHKAMGENWGTSLKAWALCEDNSGNTISLVTFNGSNVDFGNGIIRSSYSTNNNDNDAAIVMYSASGICQKVLHIGSAKYVSGSNGNSLKMNNDTLFFQVNVGLTDNIRLFNSDNSLFATTDLISPDNEYYAGRIYGLVDIQSGEFISAGKILNKNVEPRPSVFIDENIYTVINGVFEMFDLNGNPSASNLGGNTTDVSLMKIDFNSQASKVITLKYTGWISYGVVKNTQDPKRFFLGTQRNTYNFDVDPHPTNIVNVNKKVTSLIEYTTLPAELNVTPSTANVSAESGSMTLNVSATFDLEWGASKDANWGSINPDNGTGDATVSLNYSENFSVVPRTINALFSGDTATAIVTVQQAGADTILSVPSGAQIESTSVSYSIPVTSNITTWTAKTDCIWATITANQPNGEVTINGQVNETVLERTCEVTVSAGTYSDTFILTQEAGDTSLIVTPQNISIPNTLGDTLFSVISNVNNWATSFSDPWINLSEDHANGEVVVDFQANPNVIARSAQILVQAGSLSETLTLSQAAGDTVLSLSNNSAYVGKVSGDTAFSVSSNIANWTTSGGASWLTISEDFTDNKVLLSYADNPTVLERSCDVLVHAGSLTEMFTLTQAAGDTVLSLSNNSAYVGKVSGDTTFSVSSNIANWTTSGGASWLTISEDFANNEVLLSYADNPTVLERSCDVLVHAGSLAEMFTLTQMPGDTTLSLSGLGAAVSDLAGDTSFKVTSNIDTWEVLSSSSWVNVSAVGDSVVVQYLDNISVNSRTCTISIIAGTLVEDFILTQSAKNPFIDLSPDSAIVAYDVTTATTNLTTLPDLNWTVDTVNLPSGWSVAPKNGVGDADITILMTPNNANSPKTGSVIVYGYGVSDTFTVVQEIEPLNAIASANPNEISLGKTIQLSAQGYAGLGSYTYNWTFPDGTTSSSQNPTYIPTQIDTILAECEISDGAETVLLEVSIVVHDLPTVDFYADNTTPEAGAIITFTADITANNNSLNVDEYEWEIIDQFGTVVWSDTDQNPSWTAINGTFDVVLTVRNLGDDGYEISEIKHQYFSVSTGIEELSAVSYFECYPNPFREKTILEFSLLQKEHVSIILYNSSGVLVKVLKDDYLIAGKHEIILHENISGIYYVKLKTIYDEKVLRIICQ